MKGYIGITDGDWFRFLASQPGIEEVNFWQPSGGRGFRVLQPLEPFFFKLHESVSATCLVASESHGQSDHTLSRAR